MANEIIENLNSAVWRTAYIKFCELVQSNADYLPTREILPTHTGPGQPVPWYRLPLEIAQRTGSN